ncbi:MAG: signal peptidase II [Lentisphaerae bacterium]|nr:signal peptidase II [Lentisphaerota bacterium]
MVVLCVALAVAVADQVTKFLVLQRMALGVRIPVIPGFFNLSHVQNTGAAWGMLQGLNGWLVLLSVVMLAVILVFRKHFVTEALWQRAAMGLMVGGIAGNMLDRVRLGFVVDFLDFYTGVHHFPAFNIADSAICIGVGLYIVSQFHAQPGG